MADIKLIDSDGLIAAVSAIKEKVDNTIGSSGIGEMKISGVVNLAGSPTLNQIYEYFPPNDGEMRMYLVGDSSGNLPSNEAYITVTSDVLKPFFGKAIGEDGNFGVNVGDICVFYKKSSLQQTCRIIPLNDAKAPNGSFPGADGLETVWDKTRINKVDGIEWTANNVRDTYLPFPTRDGSNMNECLESGVYPWCSTGRPAGSADGTHFTCVTQKSSTADDSGYFTYHQTCIGREGDNTGKTYERFFFLKADVNDNPNWGEGWKRVDNSEIPYYISYLSYFDEDYEANNYTQPHCTIDDFDPFKPCMLLLTLHDEWMSRDDDGYYYFDIYNSNGLASDLLIYLYNSHIYTSSFSSDTRFTIYYDGDGSCFLISINDDVLTQDHGQRLRSLEDTADSQTKLIEALFAKSELWGSFSSSSNVTTKYIYANTSTAVSLYSKFTNKKSLNADRGSLKIVSGSTTLATASTGTPNAVNYTDTITLATKASKVYTVQGSYGGVGLPEVTLTVTAYNPIYYGFANSAADLLAQSDGTSTTAGKSKQSATYTSRYRTYDKTNKQGSTLPFIILVPSDVTNFAGSFTMGGAPAVLTQQANYTDSSTSITYYVWTGDAYADGGRVNIYAN